MPELRAGAGAAAGTSTLPVPRRADVSLHFLGSGGVLFDAAAQKLYAANTTATFIWCCRDEGDPPQRIAERLVHTFALSRAAADAAVDQAFDAWRRLGLLDSDTPRHAPVRLYPEIPVALARDGACGEYRLLDIGITLRCSPASLRLDLAPMLVPLEAGDDRRARCTLEVHLTRRPDGYELAAAGTVLQTCRTWDEVGPMLKGHLAVLALQHSQDVAAVHAAAVSRGERCILLPAESGRGKSTLTAALLSAGFRVLGDDTIVLGEPDLAARAMPFGICIKDGSWPLLASRFPGLAQQPIWRRPDGKIVRYLLPHAGGAWVSPSFRQQVGWIIFPVRVASGAAALRPVDKLDAAAFLLSGVHPLGKGLDARRVDRLVAWLDGTECLELRFAALEDAVDLLKRLAC